MGEKMHGKGKIGEMRGKWGKWERNEGEGVRNWGKNWEMGKTGRKEREKGKWKWGWGHQGAQLGLGFASSRELGWEMGGSWN